MALTNKINLLKECNLTRVCVATHWLARQVVPLKKHVHPGWEYNGFQDPTWETSDMITLKHLVKLLEEMFQDTISWSTDQQVRSYYIGAERDQVRHLG
jgi:hypothetical protein